MKNSKAGFIIPLIIVIVSVLVIGSGVYIYLKKSKPAISQTATQEKLFNLWGNIYMKFPSNTEFNTDNSKKISINGSTYQLGGGAGGVMGCGPDGITDVPESNNCSYEDDDSLSNISILRLWKNSEGVLALNPQGIPKSDPTSSFVIYKVSPNKIFTASEIVFWKGMVDNYIIQTPADSPNSPVPGMSEYTDSDFGFSFWYPSSWKVTLDKNFIRLFDARGKDTGLSIQKITQTDGKLLLPGRACGPAEGCVDLTYYFDVTTHTWMKQSDTQVPTTLDVSNNTMGGLHMLDGHVRFGLGTIIPLSAHKFLSVGTTPAGLGGGAGGFQNYLAKTVVATDSLIAPRASMNEQLSTIQTERDAYVSNVTE